MKISLERLAWLEEMKERKIDVEHRLEVTDRLDDPLPAFAGRAIHPNDVAILGGEEVKQAQVVIVERVEREFQKGFE
jgi:hypothetical protein